MASEENPLLMDFVFPPYDLIEPKHVCPAMRSLLNKLETELVELETTVEPTWPKLVEPLEKITDRLRVVWGIVNHLSAVKDSPELRSAIEEVQPEKVKFQLRLGQSKPIYNAFRAIRGSSDWKTLSDARKRIVEAQIKEADLNGVSLEGNKRESFNKIKQELEKLAQKFEENILDATKKFEIFIMNKKDVEGLPATALVMASQMAASKGHDEATAENGPWVITLDAPSYRSVMHHAWNRSLREEVFRAYITRASGGDLNNTPIIDQILKLRLEMAKILGFNNYAEVSMEMKMATVDKAAELIEKLRSASWDPAVQDLEDLKNLATSFDATEANDLSHWDIFFWSERLRELRSTLMSIAKHYATGDNLPEEACLKLLSARTFRASSQMLRQLRYASVDLELHTKYLPGGSESIYDIDQIVGRRTQVLPLLLEDRFLCSFSHIFSDTYAAGYYSYQWAEVLSADAFSAFEEAGLDNDKAVKEMGSKFRETVLALGGGKSPLEVFVEFRGREPSPEAFLRYSGLLPVMAVA